ncbi:MAG TPA: hypothetical protein VN657_03000 [Nitrospiraceae bacterium]|nr:hypothetical protein [Nitrospiraceae bacterium]
MSASAPITDPRLRQALIGGLAPRSVNKQFQVCLSLTAPRAGLATRFYDFAMTCHGQCGS